MDDWDKSILNYITRWRKTKDQILLEIEKWLESEPESVWDEAVKAGLIKTLDCVWWVWHEQLKQYIKTGFWILDPEIEQFIKITTETPSTKKDILQNMSSWGWFPEIETWNEILEEGLIKRLDKPGLDKRPGTRIWIWHENFEMYDEKGRKKKEKNKGLILNRT